MQSASPINTRFFSNYHDDRAHILGNHSTYLEAKRYWAKVLSKVTDGVVTIGGPIHIINPLAISALFDAAPSHATLDFSECTFGSGAFEQLLSPVERPRCHLILPFVPFEQLFCLTADKLANLDKVTILPPKEGAFADDVDLLTQFVHGIYCQTDQVPLDLSFWSLPPELKVYEKNGLSLKPTSIVSSESGTFDNLLSLPPDKLPTLKLLTMEGVSLVNYRIGWRNHLAQQQLDQTYLEVGDPSCYAYIKNPATISALFQVLTPHVKILNLNNLFFSDVAWLAFVECLSERERPITSLQFDQVTLDQLEVLLSKLSAKNLAKLEYLNFSRDGNSAVFEEEKVRLSRILKVGLLKCPKLQKLTLINWYLSDRHLGFLPLPGTKVYIENHRIKQQNPNVYLEQTLAKPDVEELFLANQELDEVTLTTIWEEMFLNFKSRISLGKKDSALLLVDSPRSVQAFFNQLNKKSAITKLSFARIQFTERAWKVFCENLIRSGITSLHFTGCHLTPEMIFSLKGLVNLQELSLNSNACLTGKGEFLGAVINVISSNQQLAQLSLAGNAFTNDDIEVLFSIERVPGLVCINLAQNAITIAGMQCLHNGPFKHSDIDLSDNPIFSKEKMVPFQEFALEELLNKLTTLTAVFYNEYQSKLIQLPSFAKELYFRKLLATQFKIENVAAEGNCLFSACSLGTAFDTKQLRQRTVEYMLANRDEFSAFMEDDKTLDDYAAVMSLEKTWGGHVEIVALSQILNCSIAVYNKEHPLKVKEGKLVPYEHNIVHVRHPVDIFAHPRTILLYRSKENHYLRLQIGIGEV